MTQGKIERWHPIRPGPCNFSVEPDSIQVRFNAITAAVGRWCNERREIAKTTAYAKHRPRL